MVQRACITVKETLYPLHGGLFGAVNRKNGVLTLCGAFFHFCTLSALRRVVHFPTGIGCDGGAGACAEILIKMVGALGQNVNIKCFRTNENIVLRERGRQADNLIKARANDCSGAGQDRFVRTAPGDIVGGFVRRSIALGQSEILCDTALLFIADLAEGKVIGDGKGLCHHRDIVKIQIAAAVGKKPLYGISDTGDIGYGNCSVFIRYRTGALRLKTLSGSNADFAAEGVDCNGKVCPCVLQRTGFNISDVDAAVRIALRVLVKRKLAAGCQTPQNHIAGAIIQIDVDSVFFAGRKAAAA